MSDAASTTVYQLKVSLRGISPMIWRRLLVPAEMMLYGLHRAIQIAFEPRPLQNRLHRTLRAIGCIESSIVI